MRSNRPSATLLFGCNGACARSLATTIEGVRMMKTRNVIATVAAMCFGTSALAAEPAPAGKPLAARPAPEAAKPMAAPATKPAPARVLPKRAVGDNSATKAAMKPGVKPRTAISLDCSKQADAKGLHGKPRDKFRNDCKKGK